MAYLSKICSREEITEASKIHCEKFFNSSFGFLNWHLGIRPYCLSGLISTSGAGKSSLLRKIIAETAVSQKILVWLTEEKSIQYQSKINEYVEVESLKENLSFMEDSSIPERDLNNQDRLFALFKEVVMESSCKIVFLDNITTSCFYSEEWGIRGQVKSARFFSRFVRETGIGIFYLAHTTAEVTDNYHRLIKGEDIRGTRQIYNESEYVYIIQKYTVNQKTFNFITIPKHRWHTPQKNFIFQLEFINNRYQYDLEVDFAEIKRAFRKRDNLDSREKKEDIKRECRDPRLVDD